MRHDRDPCVTVHGRGRVRIRLPGSFRVVLALFLAAAGSRAVQASPALIRPGLWRVSVALNAPGAPPGAQPFTHTRCLTRHDVRHARAILQVNPAHSPCRFVDFHRARGIISWELRCDSLPVASGHVRLAYGRDWYQGVIAMRIDVPQRGPQAVMERVNGRHIGVCR